MVLSWRWPIRDDRHSSAVQELQSGGGDLELTPVLDQSGESHRIGCISLCGDVMMRNLLYEAAQVLLAT
ncbi:hypothetical protein X737_27415 [Mesorhizobium sp. L48C026A00]|nr:hypothetical protein X737_27415 [Mesorhizobium sp. L48C026A00]